MSEVDRYFHEVWLGMVQPVDGLVVSIPVLVDAQCIERQPPHVQQTLLALCPPTAQGEAGPEGHAIADLPRFSSELLGLTLDAQLPAELSLYVPEGKQTIAPTFGLKKQGGEGYEVLIWDLPVGLPFDKAETATGTWDYPPSAKFDRLLRHARVPIGLLTNREAVRLVYAPHGESSGAITFRIEDMVSVGGRPILDAFVMLLSANRFFVVTEERSLPAILAESRKRQANVTNELADQVFEALAILLRGFEAASERDGRALLDDALSRSHDHLYKGLLTVLLRLVFLLYAEDRSLLPIDHPIYAQHLSVLALFDQLQSDQGAYPDSMSRRFGAWGRLITVFRAIYLGIDHGTLKMPPRHGSLFTPHEYPFLEGWGPAGSAPITLPEARAEVALPTVDDETVFRVLEKLILLDGQRLSYRALDVEQIGSVYEALMGYHVLRTTADAVCMRPDRLWLTAEEVREVPEARRAKWLKEHIGLSGAQAEKLHEELKSGDALEALAKYAAGRKKADSALSKARPGQLVLQPGLERRRTSSHYTPRSLSAPIVRRTLEPLLAVMGDEPASERILNLKVCDPAMGSGAFLVEACRFLGDQVVAAWTREKKIEDVSREHGDPLLHARRAVAQRCLYGVDKNDAAVELAKLSLWLVTLAKDLAFTFLDHSLRHGDSLVGLDFEQLRSFHWKPGKQLEFASKELDAALSEAIALRQKIGDLAFSDDPIDEKEKEKLLWDAQDALGRVRLVGDVIVGAFFAEEKDKKRERERVRRLDLVREWLESGTEAPEELRAMQAAVRERIPVFHWMVEFPEVFYAERPDPLEGDHVNRAAMMDAFFGNPPFAGKNAIVDSNGPEYASWLRALDDGAHGSADLCAQFFRRADCLLGDHGTVGLVATNTIAQGDTRAAALEWLVNHGSVVYEATRSMVWPGAAAVAVAIVHLAKGTPARNIEARLEGQPVDGITSRLTPGIERPNPVRLQGNSGLSFLGLNPWGSGFFLGRDEARSLLESDPANGACVRPFIGGEEVNTDPRQEFSRYAIYFAAMDLAEAGRWPKLLRIVKERVKPARDALGDNTDARRMKAFWWQYYGRDRPEMSSAIGGLERCLVTSCVTKHLCFSFQPTGRLFDKSLYLFPLPSHTHFAILQARVHECWVRHLSSSMRNDLRYAASDCFETFPFPAPNPRELRHALEDVGRHVYDLRAQYMADENVGLTVTYNRLKDPACTDARILELRRLHEEMDRKVLDAYAENDPEGRWGEVEVPPFCPMGDGDRKKVERFEGEVIDRLFVLNAKRAEEEKRTGASTTKASKTTTSGKSKKATERSVPEQLALGETATSGGTTRTQSEKRTPRGETP